MPLLDLNNVSWAPSPTKVSFGVDMLMADVAITKDETLTIYTTKEGVDIINGGKRDIYTQLIDYAPPLIKMQKQIKEIEDLCVSRNLAAAKKLVESLPLLVVELNQAIYTMQTVDRAIVDSQLQFKAEQARKE